MPATRVGRSTTLAASCLMAWLTASLASHPARAQDQDRAPTDQTYSYKRPSPTTITTFQSLYDICVAGGDDHMTRSGHALCVGYFTGIIDYTLATTPAAQRQVCLPNDPPLTRQQGRDKLVLWAAANPAAASQPAAIGVMQFLMASFPCPGSGG